MILGGGGRIRVEASRMDARRRFPSCRGESILEIIERRAHDRGQPCRGCVASIWAIGIGGGGILKTKPASVVGRGRPTCLLPEGNRSSQLFPMLYISCHIERMCIWEIQRGVCGYAER